ncbi:MAG TPA: DUF1614 domain-containing protein [Nitrospiraceae bacterium]|jgi:uncharacterized membrane protein|nr:DUF1614 domain-containing protein [Nitrospiraceae bacterium]
MIPWGCLPLILFLLLLILLPFAFGHLFTAALIKLNLEPQTAVLLVLAIIAGSAFNIPVKRIARTETFVVDPFAVFGFSGWWPRLRQVRRETVIAVNVGGCIVPVGLAAYETAYLLMEGAQSISVLLVTTAMNTAVCYWLAKPMEGIGIALPGFVPPFVAALGALMLAPEQATPVAFVAGVLGPLIGADLLHLRDVERIATGMASIGGAGTFDGIVLSGIVAAYLA